MSEEEHYIEHIPPFEDEAVWILAPTEVALIVKAPPSK